MVPQYPLGASQPPMHNRQVVKIMITIIIKLCQKTQLRMFRELVCILHAVHTSQTITQNTATPAKTVQLIIVSHRKIHF